MVLLGVVMKAKHKKIFRGVLVIVLVIALMWMFMPTDLLYIAVPASLRKSLCC